MIRRDGPDRFRIVQALVALVGLACTACVSTPHPDSIIHQSPQLTVQLEALSDGAMQATHPLVLPETTVARTLRGVQVVGDKSALESLFDSKLKPAPVFTEQEAALLAPHLTAALAAAGPRQQVRFRLSHLVSPVAYQEREGAAVGSSQPPSYGLEPETTSGVLYAYGRSLVVALEEYHQRPARPDSVNMPNRRLPDKTGLDRLQVVFAPEAARRPDIYLPPGGGGNNRQTTLVIDYQLLATLPASVGSQAAAPAAAKPDRAASSPPDSPAAQAGSAPSEAASAKELQSVKDLLIKKDLEMQELKEELRSIKKQLAEQDEGRQPAKPKDRKKSVSPPKESKP